MEVSPVEYVAAELMKVWFPKSHDDKAWLATDDGSNWSDIALADATVAVNAYRKWMKEYKD